MYKAETISLEKLRGLQSERLLKTIKRNYEKVPFYKSSFEKAKLDPREIKSIDDISKLPFTYKSDLRDT